MRWLHTWAHPTRLNSLYRGAPVVVAIFVVVGLASNYIRTHWESTAVAAGVTVLGWGMWGVVILHVRNAVANKGESFRNMGFTAGIGGLVSAGVVLAAYVIHMVGSREPLVASWTPEFFMNVTGATFEEFVFRVLSISLFVKLFSTQKYKVFPALLISGLLWVMPHTITKPVSMLIGLMISALIMGLIYYVTKSILFPVWLHVLANTDWFGGVVAITFYVLITALGLFLDRRMTRMRSVAPGKYTSEVGGYP